MSFEHQAIDPQWFPQVRGWSRRGFIAATAAAFGVSRAAHADEPAVPQEIPEAGPDGRPVVTRPRSTSGDDRSDVAWDERLTVVVGPRESNETDFVGKTDKAIQAAVDYVARLGGGAVKLQPGEFRLRNAVTLSSRVRLQGSGLETRLVKEPSVTTTLAVDSDWYDQEITLADAAGFQVGDGICLRTRDPHNGGTDVCKRTLIARSGNRFKLDRALRENFWLVGNTTVSTLFPLVTGEYIQDIAIENMCIDGNRSQNENLDGNYAGCIFLQDCSRIQIRDVEAANNNGDGISWQICHDCTVERCHSHDHAGLGLHPGSGSQRPVMRDNVLENCNIGLFFCWGVKWGLAENNRLVGNVTGISFGHRDTDNITRGNTILNSKTVGILVRDDGNKGRAAHRNRIENNSVVNTGDESAAAVDVQGPVEAILLAGNSIEEQRGPGQRIGVRIAAAAKGIRLVKNTISGFSRSVLDMRQPGAS